MRRVIIGACLVLVVCCGGALSARAQETGSAAASATTTTGGARQSETRVPLADVAVAFDAAGREALAGRLRTTQLVGTPEAPERNSRFVVENRSAFFYTYATGWATFYDAAGVRCGEGLWKLEALAPNESAEVNTPGLRVTCTPASWRIVATNLITRTSDAAKPADSQTAPPPPTEGAIPPTDPATPASSPEVITTSTTPLVLPPLEININGKTLPLQLSNPVEITVGKERVRIVVKLAQ